jgi:uncharacterized protein
MPSTTTDAVLLDANVLIALTVEDHEHHELARSWLGATRRFATSPSTQGSLVRYLVRIASTAHAIDALALLDGHERHEFWPDERPYHAAMLGGVVGHRQVTDAYLAAAAEARDTRIATFDRGLALLRPEAVELIA